MRTLAITITLFLVLGAGLPVTSLAESGTETDAEALRTQWEAEPDSIPLGIALQDALVRDGRGKEALSLFRRAQMRDRKGAAVGFLYGRILGGRDGIRRMEKALASGLDAATVDTETRALAWRALRDEQIQTEKLADAEASARRVLTLSDESHDWTLLGWILERRGEKVGAISAYEVAVKRREDHLWVRNALALLYARSGSHEKSIALARDTLKRFPDDTGAHLHLGLVATLSGDADAGREAYAAALESAGRNADALAAVAAAYVDIEDYELATKAVDRALAVDANHGRALLTAGVLALETEDLKRAEKLLSSALKARPKDAHAAYLLGVCCQRQGKNARAIQSFRTAARLRESSVEYQIALAMAHARAGATDAGIYALKKALRTAPQRADLHLQMGFLQIKKRRYSEAVRSMSMAADLAQEDARPHFYLAILYGDHLNRLDDARNELELYVDLGGNEPAALRWLEELRTRD